MADSMTGVDPTNGGSISYANDFPNITPADYGGSAATEANSLNQGTNAAYGSMLNFAQNMPKPLDIYSNLENQNGIPALRTTQANLSGQVNNLEDTVNNVENNVNATTGNSMVTEGQRQNMITSQQHPLMLELAPLSRALGQVGDRLTNAEQNVTTMTGLANEGNQQMLGVMGTGISVAQDNAARSMSGFTQDQQLAYQTLMAKIQRGEQLSDQERSYAQQLQMQKNDYTNKLGEISAGQKYQTYGYGGGVIDTTTGQRLVGGSTTTPTLTGGGGSSGSSNTRAPLSSFITGTPNKTNSYIPGISPNFGPSMVSGSSASMTGGY